MHDVFCDGAGPVLRAVAAVELDRRGHGAGVCGVLHLREQHRHAADIDRDGSRSNGDQRHHRPEYGDAPALFGEQLAQRPAHGYPHPGKSQK